MNTREPAVFSTKSQNLSKKRPEQQSEESTDEFPDFQSMVFFCEKKLCAYE